MRRPVSIVVVAGVVAVLAAVGLRVFAPTEPKPPPNVLFIVWDTVRADHMSLYGYDKPTTPRIEAFAKQGAVYEHATAPGMWTLNSHAAMFTGLYETTHGAMPAHRWLDEHHVTLAELLKGRGYDTFAFSANLIAGPMTNVMQGFDTLHTTYPSEAGRRYLKESKASTRRKLIPEDASTEESPSFGGDGSEKWAKGVYKDAAPVAHQALIDFLGERPDPARPFFAFVNMMEAHTPRLPSMDARRRVADDPTIRCALATDLSLAAEKQYILGIRDYTENELKAIRATYDATLVELDQATGDLLDDLEARGILDDTLVVLVSDHGESLGEHRMLEHRWTVHEPLLHVPLVLRYPERIAPARISDRVNTIDVFATVLDVVGIEPPPGTSSTSLVDREAYDPFVFSEMLDPFASELADVTEVRPDLDISPWLRTWDVVYERHWKLWSQVGGPARHLFDLEVDPGELQDRHETEVERAKRLADALAAWKGKLPPYDPGKRLPKEQLKGHQQLEHNAVERAQMCALGYLQCETVVPEIREPAEPCR